MFIVLTNRVWHVDHACEVSRKSEYVWVEEGLGLQLQKVFRGFYEIMSFVSLGASDRSRHFMNFSLLSRFDSTH